MSIPVPPIPPGLCQCGCDGTTRLARETNPKRGWIKGQPYRFLPGHQWRKPFPPTEKPCTKCGIVKPLDHFHNHRQSGDGKHSHCKECTCSAARAYGAAHPEAIATRDKKRREINRNRAQLPPLPAEKRCTRCKKVKPGTAFPRSVSRTDGLSYTCRECYAATQQQFRQRRPDYHTLYKREQAHIKREQRETDIDYQRERAKQRAEQQEATRKRRNEQSRRAYANNREQRGDRWREYYQKNREHLIARAKMQSHRRRFEIPGRFTVRDLKALEIAQGGLCAYCTQPYGRYHVDHKIPVSRGGSNWPDNLCLSCASCNLRKHAKTDAEFLALLAAAH